jgi:hypothetical protein
MNTIPPGIFQSGAKLVKADVSQNISEKQNGDCPFGAGE